MFTFELRATLTAALRVGVYNLDLEAYKLRHRECVPDKKQQYDKAETGRVDDRDDLNAASLSDNAPSRAHSSPQYKGRRKEARTWRTA